MNCLFLIPNAPLSPNYSGGASRYLTSFRALHRLGVQIYVLRFLEDRVKDQILTHERADAPRQSELGGLASGWHDVTYSSVPCCHTKLELLTQFLFHPTNLAFPDAIFLRQSLQELASEIKPDFIWAEWVLPGVVANISKLGLPWAYAHHDMLYKIYHHRQSSSDKVYWSSRLVSHCVKQAETEIVRKSDVVITGSQTEANELRAIGASKVVLIPTTYESVPVEFPASSVDSPPRIFHLGGLSTTANQLGLDAYLDRVQPKLNQMLGEQNELARLHLIGDASRGKPWLVDKAKRNNAIFHGHVDNLAAVLRPFDIAIIPYEHNTGTRTKLPLVFNYAQVVVTTAAAVAGTPEARNGENCIILSSLAEFPSALAQLINDSRLRERIGRQAKATFEQSFTLDSQLPRFAQVLDAIKVHVQ
ncbi:MAG: hypothetical protein B6D41_00025 [Chloroflexi bacterium UTCFX4]|jgi:glycosyltransferase involved in cell wall biosynthesis|nr:MAG: hypothetical protein B6D41_00025 [Chloroflexi bacterium UTCFX4]